MCIPMSITFYHFADELRCSLSDSAAAVSNDDMRPTVVLLGLPGVVADAACTFLPVQLDVLHERQTTAVLLGLPGVVADAACIFLPVQLNVLHERQPTAVLLGLPGVVADDACMCLSVQLGTSHLSFKLKPS